MTLRFVISIIASVVAFGQPAFAQPSLIVPGKSIGFITLGMTRVEVYRQLGNPTQSWTLSHDTETYGEDVWCQKQKNSFYYFTTVTRQECVVQIEASDPHYQTAKGFTTSSNFTKFRHLYPHVWVDQHLFNSPSPSVHLLGYGQPSCIGFYVDDVRQGLAVTLRSQCDKVDDELPFLNPDSVVIHIAGTSVLPVLAGKWASVEPHSADDYLDQIREWFNGGVYHPRTAQQILTMQKRVEAGRSR
jgi:hypothetical protein